jgi:hypothetical protein
MRRWLIAFSLCVMLLPIAVHTQTPTRTLPSQTERDIQQVQRDYYAIPYAMQLTVLTDAAKAGDGTINEAAIKQPMADAESFEVSLSGITTGKTADIQDQPWTNFVTLPAPGQEVVHLNVVNPVAGENYGSVTAQWGPANKQQPGTPDVSSMAMLQLLQQLDDLYATSFTRYVA